MKVAISAKAPNMHAEVDPRFGRCPCFMIVDTDTMKFEALDNTGVAASSGAGIAAAQAVADKKVQAVLTGDLGPNAHEVLSVAGIKIYTGVSGTVTKAVEFFKNWPVSETSGPTVAEHAGLAGAPAKKSAPASPMQSEVEVLKGRANTMKQQLDNLIFRIEELEQKV